MIQSPTTFFSPSHILRLTQKLKKRSKNGISLTISIWSFLFKYLPTKQQVFFLIYSIFSTCHFSTPNFPPMANSPSSHLKTNAPTLPDSRKAASSLTQANALLRKNLTFQRRNIKTNLMLLIFPIIICLLIFELQRLVTHLSKEEKKLTCGCDPSDNTTCGIEYSDYDEMPLCNVPSPPQWPPLIQIPYSYGPDQDQDPVTVLVTGANQPFGQSLTANLFNSGNVDLNSSNTLDDLANLYLGSEYGLDENGLLDQAFSEDYPIYYIKPQCVPNVTFEVPIRVESTIIQQEVICLQSSSLWRSSASVINDEILNSTQHGYRYGAKKNIQIATAYDFLNSGENNLNVNIWYLSGNRDGRSGSMSLLRLPRLVNVVSNAYLGFVRGADVKVLFDFVKEMPKHGGRVVNKDFLATFSPLLFTWVILQLFPVILGSLVYEKQQNLRIMMKMHGLGDGPYWMISYAYFLLISFIYMFCLVAFGSIMGLDFFRVNSYSIQFVFYFFFINVQIAFTFFVATFFAKVKTATVIGHIYVFGSGLLGAFLFQDFVEDPSFPRAHIVLLEMLPCFSLYRGLYEFGQYSTKTDGILWRDLSNGLGGVLLLMFFEWFILLLVAYYFDQVMSIGSGVRKHPLFFMEDFLKKPLASVRLPSVPKHGSEVSIPIEKFDVSDERKKVEQLLLEPCSDYAVVCNNLKKVYPGKDGNPDKLAVRGLSLALPRGECFGMLGPNGAGKTSSINMMIGLISPTAGTAFVHDLDIRKDMDKIYSSMGVCPQHDLLWETLTGREHLLFYGRLKNLKGAALAVAVEESLKCGNLVEGNVGDKQTRKYSGGMKRRLSVAISLIGNPKVVYMDEPSSGLDPSSRNLLWDVVKRAKQNCAIILTTHSMEEAEALCDRLGIFVDGSLQCIGYPAELKARYGGSYVFTVTTSLSDEKEVEDLVQQLFPSAKKVYHISGTQKFELQKDEVRIADVLQAVQNAKRKFPIHAWGLTHTSLEDVFIKVAKGAEDFNVSFP